MNYIKIVDDNTIPTSELYRRIKDKFGARSYWDEKELDKEFPKPKETMTRSFKMQKDPDILGKSANEMKDTPTMTLREYMIFFLKYHDETGEYPDEIGWTITSSPTSGGGVACACRDGSGFEADWSDGGYAFPKSGGREVVSPNPSTLSPSATETFVDINDAIRVVKENGYLIYKAI